MVKHEISCGVIILKERQVFLIKDVNGNVGFPKGHMNDGESYLDTALREVKEETNLDVIIFPDNKYPVSYMTPKNVLKEVIYFVGKLKDEASYVIKLQEEEVLEGGFYDIGDAIDLLTYDNVREILKSVIKEQNLWKR